MGQSDDLACRCSSRGLDLVEKLDLVESHIEELAACRFGIDESLHEGCIGHVAHQILHAESFGSWRLLLGRFGRLALLLPLLLELTRVVVTLAYVVHYEVDGHVDRPLADRLLCHQDGEEPSEVGFGIVDIACAHSMQMCPQWREDCLSHGWTVHGIDLADEELDEPWQVLWELGRKGAAVDVGGLVGNG